MTKQEFFSCDGTHRGPCPNRMARLAIELRNHGALAAVLGGQRKACRLRHLVELGRGDSIIGCAAPDGDACPYGADKPRFNGNKLSARRVCVHTFAGQASTEVLIVQKFQEQGWPRDKLFNPLGKSRSPKYGGWLKTAVFRLNQCQKLIRFRSYPSVHAVGWEWRMP